MLLYNGSHDAALILNWNLSEWNYGVTRLKKNYDGSNYDSFFSNATIDKFPALLNMTEDYGYRLRFITDHDLSYVPLNWKRYTETSVNGTRADMGIK